MVRLSGVSKSFGAVEAVRDLNLELTRGNILALLGPSGCGKTTTLRLLAGFESPDAGEIEIAGRRVAGRGVDVPPEKRRVGMVFQDYALFPHLSVAKNVAYGLMGVLRGKKRDAQVEEVLGLARLEGLEDRMPHELSGGQQQRVALARALAPEPAVVLLDEPFSNLDAKLREQMRIGVKLLQKRLNVAMLFVTHDQIEALSLSNRIALMNFGVVQQEGDPRLLYEKPANEFVRDFVGRTLLFKGKVQSANPSGQLAIALEGAPDCVVFGRTYHPDGVKTGAAVYIGVRPEDVDILPAVGTKLPSGMIGGRAQAALFIGERIEYQVEVEGQSTVLLYGERHQPIEEGSKVWLKLRPDGHSAWSSDWMHLDG